jgi:hypothetical protein
MLSRALFVTRHPISVRRTRAKTRYFGEAHRPLTTTGLVGRMLRPKPLTMLARCDATFLAAAIVSCLRGPRRMAWSPLRPLHAPADSLYSFTFILFVH